MGSWMTAANPFNKVLFLTNFEHEIKNKMKLLIIILSFCILPKLRAHLLSLSNFLTLFRNKNQTIPLSKQEPVLIQYQEIDPTNFLNKSFFGVNQPNEYLISNHLYYDIDDISLKHDLDYEAFCDVKQGFIMTLEKLEMGVQKEKKIALRFTMQEKFIQLNEKTISVFLNENPDSMQESFNLKSVEFSKMWGFNNISCFAVFSAILPNENPEIFRVFCLEDKMFSFFIVKSLIYYKKVKEMNGFQPLEILEIAQKQQKLIKTKKQKKRILWIKQMKTY